MAVIPYTLRATSVPTVLVSDREQYLYGISGGNVLRYNAAGSSTNLGAPGDTLLSLAYFKGNLYCYWWNGTNSLTDMTALGISYYNGSGWTRVYTEDPSSIGGFFEATPLMALRDVVMVAHVGEIDNGSQFTRTIVYTTNGTTWVSGSVSFSSSLLLQPNINGVPILFTDTIYMDGNTDHLNVSPPYTTSLWKFVGGNWQEYDAGYSTRVLNSYPRLRSGAIDGYWESPSSGAYNHSTDLLNWSSSPSGPDGTIVPVDSDNMPATYGYYDNGVSFYMIPWDGSAWDATDFDIYSRTTHGFPVKMFRFNTGEVFVITATGRLLQRDVNLSNGPNWNDPVDGAGQLYWGINTLTNSKAIVI